MKEINVYLSARCITPKGKGSYGYVIDSELYMSHKKASYLKTTMPRMMMRAAIDAMVEVYENVGQCKVVIYSNQAILVNSMYYGHCKKFSKRPNQDLVLESKIASEFLVVHPRSIKESECREIIVANELSRLALEEFTEEVDNRNYEGPKPTALF